MIAWRPSGNRKRVELPLWVYGALLVAMAIVALIGMTLFAIMGDALGE